VNDFFDPIEKVRSLNYWKNLAECKPLTGGLTNQNFLVLDDTGKYVVRLGDDIIEHQIMRFNELAASKAAHQAGISPKVVHSEPGILVIDYIPSRPLSAKDVRNPDYLTKIIPLIKTCHNNIPEFLRGPSLIFWVFHVVRDYAWTLRDGDSTYVSMLPKLLDAAALLEQSSGPYELVYSHNDLLSANILDDGNRLWLIDWDYAGFNSPLFDLGGLASNNEFDQLQEKWLLEEYFEKPLNDELWQRYQAMKCASLLRETMWSMVSELHSKLDIDFASYTNENLQKFEDSFKIFTQNNL
jgi:thiamine kinase-like enzyme